MSSLETIECSQPNSLEMGVEDRRLQVKQMADNFLDYVEPKLKRYLREHMTGLIESTK